MNMHPSMTATEAPVQYYLGVGVRCEFPERRAAIEAQLLFGPFPTVDGAKEFLVLLQDRVAQQSDKFVTVSRLFGASDGRPSQAIQVVRLITLLRADGPTDFQGRHAIADLTGDGLSEYLVATGAHLIPPTERELERLPYHVLRYVNGLFGPARVL